MDKPVYTLMRLSINPALIVALLVPGKADCQQLVHLGRAKICSTYQVVHQATSQATG